MQDIFEILLQNFNSSKRRVNRYLGVGIVFVLLCFLYVTMPYFQYKVHQQKAKENLQTLKKDLNKISENLVKISEVNDQGRILLGTLNNIIRSLPDELHRDVLPGMQNFFNGEGTSDQLFFQQSVPNRPFGLPPEITNFEDAVNWYLQDWFENLITQLEEGLLQPVSGLDSLKDKTRSENLFNLTKTAIDTVNSYINKIDPEFWHEMSQKEATSDELRSVVTESCKPLFQELNELQEGTRIVMTSLQDSLKSLQTDSITLENHIKSLDSRISSLNSPIGSIPLSAVELIVLFPILMVLLVILTTTAFIKSANLYNEFWSKFDTNAGKNKVEKFRIYTDCWYLPPYSNSSYPILLISFASFVMIIFLYASRLIYTDPDLFAFPGGGIDVLRRIIFLSTYILGVVLILGCFFVVYKKILNLKKSIS
jgi:hypothetical protein